MTFARTENNNLLNAKQVISPIFETTTPESNDFGFVISDKRKRYLHS